MSRNEVKLKLTHFITGRQPEIINKQLLEKTLSHYLINPKYIDEYDGEAEEIALAYKGVEVGETEVKKRKKLR